MPTIAPDQLPTPTTVRPATSSGTRQRVLRATIAAALLGVVGLGAAVQLRDGSSASGGDDRKASRERERDNEQDLSDEPDTTAFESTAGNASFDVAGSYQAIFGVVPSAGTLDCLDSGLSQVEATVVGVVNGTATDQAEVAEAMAPFAECAPYEDFGGMVLALAAEVVQPSALDEVCAASMFDTFTTTDRVGVLVDSYSNTNQFIERLYSTFAGCAV